MTANFEKKYPNVKINLKFMDFNSLVNTVNRALDSNNGPDITEGNQGYQTDALQVKAKLILPLDKYVKAYGWNKWWGPSTWQIFQWTPDGKTFGKGPKWGVAQTGQNVVLYVNTKKLADAGIKLASLTNFAAFDKALTTLRGKLPKSEPVIQFGNKEGYGTIHFLGGIQGAYGRAQPTRNWIYHVPGSTFETAQNTKALQKMADWAKAGIFNSDYNAIGYDDAAKQFAKGKGVFLYEGNWETAVVEAGLGKNVSIINMPPGPSGKHVGIGATSGPWHISAKTKYPDVAAAWLNYIIGSARGQGRDVQVHADPGRRGRQGACQQPAARSGDQGVPAGQQGRRPDALHGLGLDEHVRHAREGVPARGGREEVPGGRSQGDPGRLGQVRRHAQVARWRQATADSTTRAAPGTPGAAPPCGGASRPGGRPASRATSPGSTCSRASSSSGSSRWRRSCTRGGSRSSTGTG